MANLILLGGRATQAGCDRVCQAAGIGVQAAVTATKEGDPKDEVAVRQGAEGAHLGLGSSSTTTRSRPTTKAQSRPAGPQARKIDQLEEAARLGKTGGRKEGRIRQELAVLQRGQRLAV